MSSPKQETITFKVDGVFAQMIRRLPNRSEFIRTAVLNALENTCPLCQGSGIITPEQKTHWERFLEHHRVERCETCNSVYLTCLSEEPRTDAGPEGHSAP